MPVLTHYKVQKLNLFLSGLSKLNQLHQKKSVQFSKEFYHFSDNMTEYFKQIGDSINSAEMERLCNYFQMAEDGIDPEKIEKVKSRRRELRRRSAFVCLSTITEMIQRELEREQNKLEQAKQTLGQLILSLIQNDVIKARDLQENYDQIKVKSFWNRLNKNEQVKIQERNLRLHISMEDIYIVFGDVLNILKN